MNNIKQKKITVCTSADPLKLHSGKTLGPIEVAYETYGHLNEKKNNVILILHALTGSAHAAGRYHESDKKPGWWDIYIGSGKPLDTDKYFIICSNVIGSCQGTTGPASVNPKTGKEYGLSFPFVTIYDMVETEKLLLDKLGISELLAVIGGSMGGMQSLVWAMLYPEMVKSSVVLACGACQPPQAIAFNEVGRQSIYNDPHWHHGQYYGKDKPAQGLSVARMIGHITYLSEEIMYEKFGRKLQNSDFLSYGFEQEFAVESYLNYQGLKFVDYFDANSYLYLTKALDYFDPAADFGGSLVNALEKTQSDFFIISYTTDWLFTPENCQKIVKALRMCGKKVNYTNITSDKGHDSFLIYDPLTEKNLRNFVNREFEKVNGEK